jgi:hypothetical protein
MFCRRILKSTHPKIVNLLRDNNIAINILDVHSAEKIDEDDPALVLIGYPTGCASGYSTIFLETPVPDTNGELKVLAALKDMLERRKTKYRDANTM